LWSEKLSQMKQLKPMPEQISKCRGVLVATLFCLTQLHAADVQWDNGAGDNAWGNPINWSGDVLPATGLGTSGDIIHINLSGANRAIYSATTGDNTYQTIRIGDSGSGGELAVTGGNLASDATSPTLIATGGRTAFLTQSGGTVSFGGYLQVGLDANSAGRIELSGGTLISARNGTVGGVSSVSLALGDGDNARGNVILSGGELLTRTGVLLGNNGGTGRFEVDGAGIANIGTRNANDDGFWVQNSNSVLAAYVEDGALGTIFVDDPTAAVQGTYADGNVIFMPGSRLEVGFIGATNAGSWDVMHWKGTLLTNGLAFAPGTDTNWSFAFVDTDGMNGPDTLRISYGTPAPTAFVHPGGLHTEADFARMRTKVAAGAQPWLDGWSMLTNNSHAQLSYSPNPQANIYRGYDGVHAENYAILFNDIAAAYQCALRYQVSGDPNYANKAVEIMNAWSETLTNIGGTSDRYLAAGIYGYEFANVGEMMSCYGGWSNTEKTAFKNMMLTVFYPMNHDFLRNHNHSCISHYWANWDLCNLASVISIAVLCDDQAKFDETVDYFKNGSGNGAIGKAAYYMHPGHLCQWQESGRDQGHNTLGMALMGPVCQVAWNQGEDLYGYAGNRFLAGCEYVAKYNLSNSVPYVTYDNCDGVNQTVISENGRGTLRPCWEMIYNHYANVMGLPTPYSKQFAELARPEGGGGDYGPNSGGFDQLGFGTLTYTLDSSGATPPSAPSSPTGLMAAPKDGGVGLSWNASPGAASYNVMRATNSGGPYNELVALAVSGTSFTDTTAFDGVPYYYVVSANNAGGESDFSVQAGTIFTAGALPAPWLNQDIGAVVTPGNTVLYAESYVWTLRGAGSNIGGSADSCQYAWLDLAGDGELVARLRSIETGGTVDDKMGLMVRASTNADAMNYSLFIDANVGWSVRASYRGTAGGNTSSGVTGPQVYPPEWLKIVRTNSGSDFSSYYSEDGISWTLLETRTLSQFPATAQMGMFVCSRDTNALNTTVFDNVSATGWPASPTAPAYLAAVAGDGLAMLNWAAATNATGYNVKRAAVSGGPYLTVGANVSSLLFTNTGLNDGTRYFYVVTATNSVGESSASSEVAVRPVSLVPSPLTTMVSASTMQLNWPADHTGWHVQSNAVSLANPDAWFDVPNTSGTNQLSFPLNSSQSNVFFRLTYP
jgi:hypothetical protein